MGSWKLLAMPIVLGLSIASGQVIEDEEYYEEDSGVFEEDADFWRTDNWAHDEYGAYDEDFIWDTTDEWYETWYGDVDVGVESPHYDLLGWDDADEWGLWDW